MAPGSLSLHTRERGQLHTPTYLLFLSGTAIRLAPSSVGTQTALSGLPGEICGVLPASAGDRGGTVVKVLCYKSEGRWFDPRWCHWNFSLT